MKTAIAACLSIAAIAAIATQAEAKAPSYGPLLYSSACWEEESGDFAGMRLLLWHLPDEDAGVVEWSEGPKEAARLFQIKFGEEGAFSFKFDENDWGPSQGPADRQEIAGVISDAAVEFTWNKKKIRLPRVTDFSKKTPGCGQGLKTK